MDISKAAANIGLNEMAREVISVKFLFVILVSVCGQEARASAPLH